MRRCFITALLICGCGAFGQQGASQDGDLPLLARSALQEYERAVELARKKAVEKLKAAMKAEMQSGTLERANRINEEIRKISASDPAGVRDGAFDRVAGEWRTPAGVIYTLDKKQRIECGNGWSGTWSLKEQKIHSTLNTLNGKVQPSQIRYYYNMPAEKVINGRKVIVMDAPQPGYVDLSLTRQ